MSTAAFEDAIKKSKTLEEKPSNEDLLKLYAYYKQATEGDNQGERPTGFDFKGIAKHDAWAKIKGKSKEEAMQAYVTLVEELFSRQ